jgi:glycosyltransferase involved in cell wall biosynthesis
MEVAADTAAVMVTHNGRAFLWQQCDSIFRQSVLPAVLAIVDDSSSDGTRNTLRDIARQAPIPMEVSVVDSSGIADLKTRVATNVLRGLAAVSEYEIVLLADQDDEWLPGRLASQREAMRNSPTALLVAGDGLLVDSAGNPTGDRLRDVFPPPEAWASLDAAGRMKAALRRPFVTGAASALSAELVSLMTPIPGGWLHDRWATLVAAARNGLLLQDEPVIRYRIHPGQLLGFTQARTGLGKPRWRQVLDRGTGPLEAAAHARDVVSRLKPIALDPRVRAELSWRAVLASGAARS